jgi:hypothetical protein
MTREAKLLGFAILLAVIFVCAHAAGSRLGPVTTSHSQVSYPGLDGTSSGMQMGQPASPPPARPSGARPPGARPRGAGR